MNVKSPVTPPEVALTVAVPGATAVIVVLAGPELVVTLMTDGADDCHCTSRPFSCTPAASRTVAVTTGASPTCNAVVGACTSTVDTGVSLGAVDFSPQATTARSVEASSVRRIVIVKGARNFTA
ncbi:MAG: hypothetical protein V9F02_08100 [Chitinophagaceae bacterium]